MSTLKIELQNKLSRFRLRAEVKGCIEWHLAQRPEQMTLQLYWQTAGRAVRDFGLVARLAVEAPRASGSHEFAFRLPHGPCGFKGEKIAMGWPLELSDGENVVTREIEVSHLARTL